MMQLKQTLNLQHEENMSILGKGLLFLSAFLSPIIPAMLATGFLITVDFITGVWAAKKRGEVISSKKMSKGVTKIILYNIAIITGHVIELYMVDYEGEPIIPLTRVVLGFIALVEFKSISENIYAISGIKIWDSIKETLRRKTDIEIEEKQQNKKKRR